MVDEKRPETPNLLEPEKPGKWVTVAGRRVFIPEGKKLEDVFSPDDSTANKASYMTAGQEPPVKTPYNENVPHYIVTAHELQNVGLMAPRPGEFVKYDHGQKDGILITVDRSLAKILNKARTGYDFIYMDDVARAEDYTAYGLWKDIPDNFKAWMLRKAKAPELYVNKKWNQLPKALKDVLRDETVFRVKDDSVFEETARTGQHANPTAINGYDGAKDTLHKHADAKNPEHKEHEGLSGNLINPQKDKRRDGRQFPDNEEQNNTFSAGSENPKEPYSVNVTGGSNFKEDYGTSLEDWRAAKPKPSKDVEQTLKVDSGASSISGETDSLNSNPKEIDKSHVRQVGVPEISKPATGVKYLSKSQAEELYKKLKKDAD